MNSTVRTTFAWLSTTPRGRPVLPDVYWMKATSSVSAAGNGGAGPSASRSLGSGTWRVLAAGAPRSPTPRREPPEGAAPLGPAAPREPGGAAPPAGGGGRTRHGPRRRR